MLDTEVVDVLAAVRRGLGWWTGHLADVAAPLLRPLGARGGMATARRLSTGGFELRRGGVAVAPGSARTFPAAVLLSPEACLTLALPAPGLTERDWRRLLASDVDRLTPFSADAVFVAVRFDRGGDGSRLATVGFTPRPYGMSLLCDAVAAGVAPTALLVETGDGAPLDFLPTVCAAGYARVDGRARALWMLVSLLLALNVGVAVWRDVRATDHLADELAQMRPAAEKLTRMKRAIDGETARRGALATARHDRSPLALLDRLARVLPQGAWVQRLSFEDGTARLSGLQVPGTDAGAALRASPGFANVRDLTLDLADTTPGAARPFDLRLEVVPTHAKANPVRRP